MAFHSDAGVAGAEELASASQPAEPAGQRRAVTIKVITAERALVDLATASPEQLATLFDELRAVEAAKPAGGAPAYDPAALDAFGVIAVELQGPLAPLLSSPWEPAPPGALSSVLARELLANPAVRPIVIARGAASAELGTDRASRTRRLRRVRARASASAEAASAAEAAEVEAGEPPPSEGAALLTRAARRTRAIDLSGRDASLAAEEPVSLWGFAVDPEAAGAAIAAAWAHLDSGYASLAASGSYTAPLLAAAGPIHPPEAPGAGDPGETRREPAGSESAPWQSALARRGFRVIPCETADAVSTVLALLRQARAAVDFYQSGAAAAVAFALVEAAVARRPGAPRALSALAPRYCALSGPMVVSNSAESAAAPGTWRGPRALAALRALLRRLAQTEPVAADEPGTWAFDLSPLQDLYQAGALGLYLDALTGQADGERVAAHLSRLSQRLAQATHGARLAAQIARDAARARLYVLIVEDRFGAARLAQALAALRAATPGARGAPGGRLARPEEAVRADNPDAVLELLTPAERAVVLSEYDRRLEEWAGTVGNKCPHVRIARRLRAARDAPSALRALTELSRFFAAGPGRAKTGAARDAEWLLCRNCGFRALCPHVRARIEMEAQRRPHEAIRARLVEFAVNAPGAGTELFAHYCRLCGERLAEIRTAEIDPAQVLGRFGELDAGLRAQVWAIAATAARQVRFPVPTDERVFATTVAATVFPLLLAAEEATGRRRRSPREASRRPPNEDSEEPEIDPLLLVDAVLFVHAYILELIRARAGRRHQEVGFAGVKAGARLPAVGDAILRHVVAAHRNLIVRAEEATDEYLRARFTEAFRAIQKEGGVERADEATPSERPEVELANFTASTDPIYRYAVAVARVAGDLPAVRPADPESARKEFETVLGGSLPSIIKTARESAKDPALAALYLRRTGLEVPPGGTLDQLLKDPRVNLHVRLYDPPPTAPSPEALAAFRALSAGAPRVEGGSRATGAAELGGAAEKRAAAEGILQWAVPAEPRGETESILRWAVPTEPRGAAEDARGPIGGAARTDSGRGHRGSDTLRGHKGRPAPRRVPVAGQHRSAKPEPPPTDAAAGGYFEAYRLFARYTRGLQGEALAAWEADMARYHRSEAALREAAAAAALPSFSAMPFRATQQYVPQPVTLAHLYDEEGRHHCWSGKPAEAGRPSATYIYDDPAGKRVEIRGGTAAVVKARDSGQVTPEMVLVDIGCPVCGRKFSEIGALDPAAVEAAVRRAAEIDAFFAFYESRCPKGEVHQMEPGPNGLQCRRCGLEAAAEEAAEAGRAAGDPVARAYYARYRAEFAAARLRARKAEAAPGPAPPPAAAPVPVSFQPDYTLVVRAAELAATTPAAIEAIGSTEGRPYEEVLEGRNAPPPPASLSDPRLFDADAEVRFFLSEYARLRFFSRFARPPPAAAELIAAAAVPAHELGGLPGALPDVGKGYPAELEAAKTSLAVGELLGFIVQRLCRFALEIAAVPAASEESQWRARLGQAFAKQTLQQVLRNQRLLARPGAFNWAIFVEDQDDDAPDDAGDVGEDLLVELLDTGEEAPEDPFSGEHFDYDTSEDNPNNEPA